MSKKTTTTTTTTVVTTVEETPTKNKTVYYKFILDRSGSMESIQKPTIDSYNEQIVSLKRLQTEFPDRKYIVSLIIFDDVIETIIDNKPVNEVEKLNYDSYMPRGATALRDAIGKTIQETKINFGKLLTEHVDENECMITVLTDGYENASKEFSNESLRRMLNEVNERKNWTLMFIGSSEESVLAARDYGFSAGNTAKGLFTADGIKTMNTAVSNVMYRKAYASTRGVDLGNTEMLSAVSDADGWATTSMNTDDIDEIADNNGSTSSGE
jgi:uncharacterized protein YegL